MDANDNISTVVVDSNLAPKLTCSLLMFSNHIVSCCFFTFLLFSFLNHQLVDFSYCESFKLDRYRWLELSFSLMSKHYLTFVFEITVAMGQ